jgi:hypothetical protein
MTRHSQTNPLLRKNNFIHSADYRNPSDIEGGTEEYLDALGVFDWLVNAKGIPFGKIGIGVARLAQRLLSMCLPPNPS